MSKVEGHPQSIGQNSKELNAAVNRRNFLCGLTAVGGITMIGSIMGGAIQGAHIKSRLDREYPNTTDEDVKKANIIIAENEEYHDQQTTTIARVTDVLERRKKKDAEIPLLTKECGIPLGIGSVIFLVGAKMAQNEMKTERRLREALVYRWKLHYLKISPDVIDDPLL